MEQESITVPARRSRDAAFESYVSLHQPRLLRTAFLLTGDLQSAEDLLQSALVKLYLSWHRVERRDAIDGYVRRIMVHEQASWWRLAWRRREISVDLVPDHQPTSASGFDEVSDRDAMWDMLRTLTPRQRAAVVLRYYEDLSEAQTAVLLNCSVGTIKSQTSRALASLRSTMLAPTPGGDA